MCVIIVLEPHVEFSSNYIQQCALDNPHGVGILIENGKKAVVRKNLDSDSRWAQEVLERHQDKRRIIHFRLSTGGELCRKNIHPFSIGDQIFLFHNGVIPVSELPVKKDASGSDTYNLCRYTLKPILKYHSLDSPLVQGLIRVLTSGSRILIWEKGNLHYFGNWELFDKRIPVSNLNFLWNNLFPRKHGKKVRNLCGMECELCGDEHNTLIQWDSGYGFMQVCSDCFDYLEHTERRKS